MIKRTLVCFFALWPFTAQALTPGQELVLFSGRKVLYANFTASATLPPWLSASGGANGTVTSCVTGLVIAASAPRFDCAGGILNGLLAETSSINLLLQSTFSASWTSSNGVLTANTGLSPDGTTDAAMFQDSSSATFHNINQPTSSAITQSIYSFSMYAKPVAGRWLTISLSSGAFVGAYATWDLTTGIVTQSGSLASGALISASNTSVLPSGYCRIQITANMVNYTPVTPRIATSNSATYTPDNYGRNVYVGGSNTYYYYGAQLEQASLSTSYIPTTTSTVTRSADVITPTGAAAQDFAQGGSAILQLKSVATGTVSRAYAANLTAFTAAIQNQFIQKIAVYPTQLSTSQQTAKLTAGAPLP